MISIIHLSPRSFGVLRRLHTVAGVIVAPFLIVAALTGVLYALAPSLEKLVYADLTRPSGEAVVSLEDQVEAAREVYPDLALNTVQVIPGENTRVLFADDALPSKSYTHAVFVDPATGEVRGEKVQYGSSRALPLRASLSNGHRSLWLGEPGRLYSELAASWMGALTIGGLVLWLGRRKRTRGTLRTHAWLGALCSAGFLFLTVTGLTWSSVAGGNIGKLRTLLHWKAPQLSASASEHAGHGAGSMGHMDMGPDLASLDGAYDVAREAGLRGIFNLQPNGAAWNITEARAPFVLHNDAIAVADGHVVERVNFSEWPLAAKLTEWLINLHMGFLFGLVNQIVLALIALALLAVSILGLVMWFRRGRRFAGPQGIGKLSRSALVTLVLCLVIYAVIAPLFGISLVVFLVVDAVWRAVRGAGATGSSTPPATRPASDSTYDSVSS